MGKDIAIIGGGIAGLSALDILLGDRRARVKLYEASDRVGGRIYTAHASGQDVELGASYFHEHYPGILGLLQEYGMGNRFRPYESDSKGFLSGGKVVPLSKGGLIKAMLRGRVSPRDVACFAGLKGKVMEQAADGGRALAAYRDSSLLNFTDTLGWYPLTREGYVKPFSEFTRKLPRNMREGFMLPFLRHTIFAEPEETNEAIGKAIFVPVTGTQVYGLAGGMERLPSAMHDEMGAYIELESPVQRMERVGNKWNLATPGEEREYDYVICTVPLSRVGGFLEGFEGVKYARVTKALARGELRKGLDSVDTLFIGGEDFRGIDSISRRGEFYKISSLDRELPGMDEHFRFWEVIDSREWTDAIPVAGTSREIPRMDPEGYENLLFAGDFALPCMEMSVDTGQKAARKAISELSGI